jgi:hypothetical protein
MKALSMRELETETTGIHHSGGATCGDSSIMTSANAPSLTAHLTKHTPSSMHRQQQQPSSQHVLLDQNWVQESAEKHMYMP